MCGEGKVVCVTGASGYVASWLVKLLLERGYTVKGTLRNLNDPNQILHLKALNGADERLHLLQADLLEDGSFDSLVDGCEGVFHTASPVLFSTTHPQAELIEPAVQGTINVLRSCSKVTSVRRVVVTASIASVTFNKKTKGPDVVIDETWFSDPVFCEESQQWYALSKTLAERAAWKFAEENGIDLVVMNPGFMSGPMLQPTLNVTSAIFLDLTKEYGDVTDIYSCDTFNENSPPTSDPTYISSLGSAVYKAMSTVDKDAVWLMQGWLFYSDSVFWKPPQMKALLHSVPFGKMIVLDLFADVKPIWKSSSQFYDTPYIWCMLHNFGGNIEMYGILDAVASGPIDARVSKNSTMIGVGMCMEGIEHNPIVYELMSEMAFRSDPLQLEEWLTTYSRRRYGKSVQQVEAAWKILHRTIYNCTDGIADHNTDYIVKFPDWDPSVNNQHARSEIIQRHKLAGIQQQRRFFLRETSSTLPRPHLWYNNQDAVSALKLFLDAGDELAEIPIQCITLGYSSKEESSPYLHALANAKEWCWYDLVDLTRQSLSKLANEVYLNAIHAFRDKDPKALSFHSLKFLQLTKDIDTLLAADDNFLLGTWLESAKKLSVNAEETKQYEWNARTQVTMWYDNTKYVQSKLHDYANKFWAGLLEAYYLPRAAMYFKRLLKSLEEKEKFKLEEWREEWIAYSNKWQAGTELYPVTARGNAVAIAKELYQKYLT
ncbi:UNVERIFIED_CONTAM: Alpha-N-acetylglucosaminidase [Sesamum calycinum]|uniref:Dihydroflavonol 4-reductase n=1 Tax=Sesamum calycinum TaxID=2727403 RepID=A0AAW2J9K9_9LAMI